MEFVVDWESVCLVCLQGSEMKSIYDKDGEILISEKIVECSDIEKIEKGMNLPEQICLDCYDDLKAAYRFRKNCESSTAVLNQFNSFSSSSIFVSNPGNVDTVKRIKVAPRFEIAIKKEESNGIQTDDESNEAAELSADYINDTNDEEMKLDLSDCNESLQNEMKDVASDANNSSEVEQTEQIVYVHKKKSSPKLTKKNEKHVKLVKNTKTVKTKRNKRGRPKEITPINIPPDNIVNMVNDLTSVAYIKKDKKIKKPLKICELCGNGYKYQNALDSHMRRHRNERPFSCDFCDKSFVANVELRRHMRVHTGQKPYSCQFCPRSFSDFGSRIKHERTHTGERPYECDTCGKRFAYSHVLSVHKLTHTGEKRFKCEQCGKGFTKKAYLLTHYKHCKSVIHIQNISNIEIVTDQIIASEELDINKLEFIEDDENPEVILS